MYNALLHWIQYGGHQYMYGSEVVVSRHEFPATTDTRAISPFYKYEGKRNFQLSLQREMYPGFIVCKKYTPHFQIIPPSPPPPPTPSPLRHPVSPRDETNNQPLVSAWFRSVLIKQIVTHIINAVILPSHTLSSPASHNVLMSSLSPMLTDPESFAVYYSVLYYTNI